MNTILITGASSGFGKACAIKFAAAGYKVILNARRADRLESLAKMLRDRFFSQVLVLPFDIRDKDSAQRSITNLPDTWSSIDILVNNAGLAVGRDPFHEGEINDWEAMIDTNIKGLIYVTKFVVNGMIERNSGHIINVSSLAGHEVYPQGNVYCATKHAVTALSKALRMDLLPHRIKVTNISPGLAETEFSIVRFKGDTEKAGWVYDGYQPLSAQDVAEVIYFAATRPPHVNLDEITILPTAQSDSRSVNREHS